MGEETKKFLTAAFVLLLVSLVGIAPLFMVEKVNAADGSWTTLAPLPMRQFIYQTDVAYTGTAALNGKVYYIDVNMTLRYDPEANNWTELAPLPAYNGWGTLVACQNKIYVIGGSPDRPTQVYDPSTDTWENKTSIPTTRMSIQANVVDGEIYVISGQPLAALGVVNPSSSNYVYNPETDSWSEMAPIPVPVMGYASAVVDNKIYIISGGHEGGPDYEPINLVQIFAPATNQWTNGTSIPTAVYGAGAGAITLPSGEKKIHVIGGQLTYYWRWPADAVDLNQVYDIETDTWTTGILMPTPRSCFDAVVINDEIYAIGGRDRKEIVGELDVDTFLTENEKYTPAGYIPEFPPWTILPLLLAVTVAAVIYKHKLTKYQSILGD